MAKITYTATDAAGHVHTRKSERGYTHTVVALPSFDFDMARATDKGHAKADSSNYDYYVQVAAGQRLRVCYRSAEKWTAEEIAEEKAWIDAANAKAIADAKEKVDGVTCGEYIRIKQAERVSAVHRSKAEGYYRAWRNMGWCGRADLAQKLAATCQNARFAKVAILPATAK